MKLNAQAENVRMLAATLGIHEAKAEALLNMAVAITYDEQDSVATRFARHVEQLISRTIKGVALNPEASTEKFALELVVGKATPSHSCEHLFVIVGKETIVICTKPTKPEAGGIHPAGLLLGACYAVGAILRRTFKDMPFPMPETLEISLVDLVGEDLPLLYKPVQFGEAYLAGAGAIGNGFICGLGQFEAHGILNVVDDDVVSDGNLQRCAFFKPNDVDLPKAVRLCEAAKEFLPNIVLKAHTTRLQNVPAQKGGGPWLKRLIVGVDSPRARRSLQSEIPGEVYDASTTGISEVVLHFNRQPNETACLSCLYHESPEEQAHEKHVADTLGVSIEEVKQNRISDAAAFSICKRYPQLEPPELIGLAYDTLFKQLCSTGQLKTPEGRQVLAPFAFVSVLAGTLLAIEFVRRVHNDDWPFNEWHVSPWANPVLRLRRVSGRKSDCEFCGNPILSRVARQMWQNANI